MIDSKMTENVTRRWCQLRGMCCNRNVSGGKEWISFCLPLPVLYFRPKHIFSPPPSPVGKCKVIISNVQRAFHLHVMVSGAISKLE